MSIKEIFENRAKDHGKSERSARIGISVRLSASEIQTADYLAKRVGIDRSKLLRELIALALKDALVGYLTGAGLPPEEIAKIQSDLSNPPRI